MPPQYLTLYRLLPAVGLLGALLLWVGDQLLFYGPASGLSHATTLLTGQVPLATMGHAAPERLAGTAVLALITTWAYVVGAGTAYVAAKPAHRRLGAWAAGALALSGVGIGVSHTAYFGIAAAAQQAAQASAGGASGALGAGVDAAAAAAADVSALLAATVLTRRVFDLLVAVSYVPALLATVAYGLLVWRRQSLLPRWSLAVFPALTVHTQYLLLPCLPDSVFKVVVMGGYVNFCMALFYGVLLVLLWRHGRKD